MQQDAREVMSRRIQAKQRAIERVRHPSQRMPVRLLRRGQGPRNRIGSQALADVRIIDDIAVVVIVHERMAIDGIV